MEKSEFLQPHELAERIKGTGYEVKGSKVESARLSDLIDRSETVWPKLAAGRFEEDEHGFATIGVMDYASDYTTSCGNHVDALVVYFNDPYGVKIPLGNVSRLTPWGNKATAYVVKNSERETFDPLLPTDERWDAVVGVVERAVDKCIGAKRTSEGRR